MTEAEWLSITDVRTLAEKINRDSVDRISTRKARLFGASYLHALSSTTGWVGNEQLRAAIEVVERYADELTTTDEIQDCLNAIRGELVGPHGRPWDALHVLLGEFVKMPATIIFTVTLGNITEFWGRSPLPAEFLRDIFGNPFRSVTLDPSWLTSTVIALATGIYKDRAFDRMPILADALQDAGCDNEDVLYHCRQPGVHVRGCFVVDLLLGKT